MSSEVVLETSLPLGPVRRGKVRDCYDLGDQLLIISTDRISAFDWVLPNGIPDKGRILTQLSAFWFKHLPVAHHALSTEVEAMSCLAGLDRSPLRGRTMLCRKAKVVPIECVVRGYLAGSGWSEYRRHGRVCGVPLPAGLEECSRLPEPIFTPATKAESGHDENISFDDMAQRVGTDVAQLLRERSVEVYRRAAEHAQSRGIIIADTKFEWGFAGDELLLVDEALTPDSSRFWPGESYRPGQSQPSLDKQPVRDWLDQSGWDKNSPPPRLPEHVVQATRQRYVRALEALTGRDFA